MEDPELLDIKPSLFVGEKSNNIVEKIKGQDEIDRLERNYLGWLAVSSLTYSELGSEHYR